MVSGAEPSTLNFQLIFTVLGLDNLVIYDILQPEAWEMTGKAGRSRRFSILPPPLIPRPHPWRLAVPILRDQSLHFANRNPTKSMKTSHGKNFNRYTFRVSGFVPTLRDANLEPRRVSGFVLANPESKRVSGFVLANPESKRVSGFVLANPESKKDLCELCDSVASRSLEPFAALSPPAQNSNNESAIRNRSK
jgi:hypothetical protein